MPNKAETDPAEVIIPFGKHKGKMIGQIPSGYLRWAAENINAEYYSIAAENELLYRDRHDCHFEE